MMCPVIIVSLSLALIVLLGGMFLLAYAKKESLGKMYKITSYVAVLFGTTVFIGGLIMALCGPCHESKCNKGGMKCTKEVRMECTKGGSEMECHKGGAAMKCHEGMMENGACMKDGKCAKGMGEGSCCAKGAGECKDGMMNGKPCKMVDGKCAMVVEGECKDGMKDGKPCKTVDGKCVIIKE